MERTERDWMVLGLLEPGQREEIEAMVDEILGETMVVHEASSLLAAAGALDACAAYLRDDEKLAAWMIAAALRERANPAAALH